MAQDFYDLLGVAKDADASDIKKAYRRRARELHPDVSEAPDAEEQFRRVTEAYEVLSDEEQRSTYDRYGEAGLRSGGWEPQFANFGSIADIFGALFGDDRFGGAQGQRGMRGDDIRVGVRLSFRDAVLGCERELRFAAPDTCETCDGSGAKTPADVAACTTCQGTGVLREMARSIFGNVVQERACPRCHGRGSVITAPCGTCDGVGVVTNERTMTVAIPAGIADSQRIRLSGRGGAGSDGGPAGHLLVDVRVEDDERFLREDDDLITVVDLTMAQAALGATIAVPTVDGDPRDVVIAAGTQPGTRIVLRGLGAGRLRSSTRRSGDQPVDRGDLVVFCNVQVPRDLTDEQREALERFQTLEVDRNYGERASILDRLKRMVTP
jgi:molecular chaperone DnaJ